MAQGQNWVRPSSHQALKARQPGVDVECLCCEQAGFVPGALAMAMKAAGLRRRPAGAQGASARRGAHAGPGGRGALAMKAARPMRAPPPARALAMRVPPTPPPAPRPGAAAGNGRRGGELVSGSAGAGLQRARHRHHAADHGHDQQDPVPGLRVAVLVGGSEGEGLPRTGLAITLWTTTTIGRRPF